MGRYKQRKGDREPAVIANDVGNDAGDWQSRVNAILDANLHRRVNGRVASKRTMEHNRTVINHAFQTWHNKLNHQIKVPQNLTDRHVQVLVRYWYEEGKAATTMRNDLSARYQMSGEERFSGHSR